MAAPAPHDAPQDNETSTFEIRLGACVVWLMFLGLGLAIWPGWTRMGSWLH